MTRFQVDIEGSDLQPAREALDSAGIPTIATPGDGPGGKRRLRRRFFRSAAFPILLIILIAFIAQRLISPAESENAPSYDQFLAQVEKAPGTIEKVTLDPDDTSIDVEQRNGADYEMGYPPYSEEALVNALQRQRIETVVKTTGGSSLLSLIFYLLPFLLFLGFWMLFLRRLRRDGYSPIDAQLTRLEAVVHADSEEHAEKLVRAALPGRKYGLGKPQRSD